jgi:MGT family glycosyltransferase
MCMGGVGHVQVLLPLVEKLCQRGCSVRAMTRTEFRVKVEAAGARFVDLYAQRPLEAADATSIPLPCRFVSFAAAYASSLASEIAAWAPDLIVYDTFTVAGPVVARLLGVPYVNVCPNHALVPARTLAALRADPRVAVSSECRAAVERLKREHGMHDASPFSYVQALSPFLNLYCEPAEFLATDDRAALAPLEFFGSLPAPRAPRPQGGRPRPGPRPQVYVSFGTGVPRYYEVAARAALTVVADTLAGREVDVVVGLGGHALAPAARAALTRPNVRIEDYVDQWAALAEADVFMTHHGLSSTHEAIFHGVPMLSYPFFGDQPALACRCQELGLALPLTRVPRAALEPRTLSDAIARVIEDHDTFAARLAQARSWELRTIAGRDAVLDRLLALSGTRP